jgi:hypothetical protein
VFLPVVLLSRRGGGAAAYTPATAPGYATALDLDAAVAVYEDTGTTPASANDDVWRWDSANGSGQGSFLSSFELGKPKYRVDGGGRPYIELPVSAFDPIGGGGIEYFNDAGLDLDLGACSVYAVFDPATRAKFQGVISFGTASQGCFGSQQDGSMGVYANSFSGGANVTPSGLPVLRWQYGRNVLSWVSDGSSVRFKNHYGSETVASSPGAGTRTGCRLFGSGTNTTNGIIAGSAYRVLVYREAHAPDVQDQVWASLAAQYAATEAAPDPDENLVVFFGDSRSYGQQTRITKDLPNTSVPSGTQFRNLSIGGSSAASLTARKAEVDAMYSASRSRNVLVMWEGVNAAYSLADLSTLYALADYFTGNGWRVILPSEIPNYSTTDAARQTWLNDPAGFYATAASHCYATADFAAEATMGVRAGSQPATFADNVHGNDYTPLGGVLGPVLTAALA